VTGGIKLNQDHADEKQKKDITIVMVRRRKRISRVVCIVMNW